MASLMLVIGSLVFGCSGIAVTLWGVRAIQNRQGVPDVGRPVVQIWIRLNLLFGLSMLAAAVVLWTRWEIGLILGLWPATLLVLLRLVGIIRVESRLSACEPDDDHDSN